MKKRRRHNLEWNLWTRRLRVPKDCQNLGAFMWLRSQKRWTFSSCIFCLSGVLVKPTHAYTYMCPFIFLLQEINDSLVASFENSGKYKEENLWSHHSGNLQYCACLSVSFPGLWHSEVRLPVVRYYHFVLMSILHFFLRGILPHLIFHFGFSLCMSVLSADLFSSL